MTSFLTHTAIYGKGAREYDPIKSGSKYREFRPEGGCGPGRPVAPRTAGGGRSFPPVAGSFRMVAVIRVMLVASSNRTRENGQRSKSRVLPPRASRNPYDRTAKPVTAIDLGITTLQLKANRRHTKWCAQQVGTHVLH